MGKKVEQEKREMTQQFDLYKSPSMTALATYVCVAVVIFFAGFNVIAYHDMEELKTEVKNLRTQVDAAKVDAAVTQAIGSRVQSAQPAAFQPMLPAAPQPVPFIAPAVPVAEKETDAPVRIETAVAPAKEAKEDLSLSVGPAAGTMLVSAATTSVKTETANLLPAPEVNPSPAKDKPRTEDNAIEIISGQILATNPDQMRVMLSLGATSGIEEGKRFVVYRAKRWVGEIRVAKVYSDMSMCEIISTTQGIRVDDVAKGISADFAEDI